MLAINRKLGDQPLPSIEQLVKHIGSPQEA